MIVVIVTAILMIPPLTELLSPCIGSGQYLINGRCGRGAWRRAVSLLFSNKSVSLHNHVFHLIILVPGTMHVRAV